jgi:hypothetical protein
MATAYIEIEEYLWLDETIQGNVNVGGLVFDDLVEETLGLGPEEVLTVFSDVLEETLGLGEGDFTGTHLTEISDAISFTEQGGPPLRVRQSVLNLIMTTPVVPALIAHVHMDVLHGVDIYWEEVSSELQAHSSYVNAVPYWWEWIYEDLNIAMTEPQPQPPITVTFRLVANDLANMRHEITQEYYFNSACLESFFIWDRYSWGWKHQVESSLIGAETVQEIIGKVADEYLLLEETPEPLIKVLHIVEDLLFAFDASVSEKFYLHLADETITITEGEVSFVPVSAVGDINEVLGIGETVFPQYVFGSLATESMKFADVSTFVRELIIQEGLDMGDVDLARWVFCVLVESGCSVSDIVG